MKFSEVCSTNEEIDCYNFESHLTLLGNQLQFTDEFLSKGSKDLLFVLIVLIAAENISCIHIKQ